MADGLVHCVEKGGWHPTVLYLDGVIYKRVVARKMRLTRRFSLFCLLNK